MVNGVGMSWTILGRYVVGSSPEVQGFVESYISVIKNVTLHQ